MRILADENISEQVVVRLRAAGQDVRWTKETDRGEADPNLLELATRERRALITYDSAFFALRSFNKFLGDARHSQQRPGVITI